MSDHVNILANRMRSATSAAQRKILMQQAEAVNFAVTDQKGQPLKVGDKVKTSRGVTGIITEIIGSRVYVQSADSFDTHKTGEATWVEPADRLVKMQADVSMASDPLEAARERASKAVSLYDDADAALEKAAKEYQQAKKAAEDARVAASRELSQAMHTRDGSRPITSAEVDKMVSQSNKRLKSFDERLEKAGQAYQQARKDYAAAAAAKEKAQAEFVVAKVQARSGKMQADVSMAVSREDREQAADVARRANQQKKVIEYANMISRIALDIGTATQNDQNQRSRSLLSNLKNWVKVMQSLLEDLD